MKTSKTWLVKLNNFKILGEIFLPHAGSSCLKMIRIVLMVFVCSVCVHGQTLKRLKLHPLDFKIDSEYFPNKMHQVESQGREVYLRSKKDPYLIVINPEGQIVKTIGQRGNGPGEFSQGVLAMGVYGDQVFAMDVNNRNHLQWFTKGSYQARFEISSTNHALFGINSSAFAVSDKHVVFPASPRTGFLAFAYSYSGEMRQGIGSLQFDKRDTEMLEKIPDLNDTNWVYQRPYWYCLFKYFPLIHQYDENFKLVSGIPLDHPRITQRYEEILDFNRQQFNRAPPLFFDFKAKGRYLYATFAYTLVQVDLEEKSIKTMYSYYGEGLDFEDVTRPNIHHFTILDDGKIFLSGAFVWGHDLWFSKLPEY